MTVLLAPRPGKLLVACDPKRWDKYKLTMFSIAANTARHRAPFLALPSHALVREIYILVNPRTQNKRKEKPKNKKSNGRASYRFVDRTRVRVVGGAGGKGNMSMVRVGRKYYEQPDGGHGGRGGNVIIVADPKEQSLNWTSPHARAESGAHGSSQKMHGRSGKNLVLRVPCGVVVRRILNSDEIWDPVNKMVHQVEQGPDGDEINEVVDKQGVEYVFEMGLEDESDYDENDDSDFFDKDTDDIGDSEYDENDDSFDNEGSEDEEDRGSRNTLNLIDEEKSISTDDAVAGDDMVSSFLELPPGQERESVVLADLDKPGSYVVVARGGRGGYGT